MSNRFNFIYLESWRRELSIGIYMGPIGGGGGGGGSPGDSRVFLPPPKNLLGHSYEILNISSESSAQAQSIGTLFGQIGLRGGVCGLV